MRTLTLDMLHTFKHTVVKRNLIAKKDRIMIGVSGGADSVCLLHMLVMLKDELALELAVFHLNHCLRGAESDGDQEFVEAMCKQLNIICFTERVDVMSVFRGSGRSLEETSRDIRYQAIKAAAARWWASKIALAHIADDQAEELLMRIIRGTSAAGIAGIPLRREDIFIRPLLNVQRSQIVDFLDENRIRHREDSSNKDQRFFRNRVRHRLMPLIKKEFNPLFVKSISRLADISSEEEDFISEIMEHEWKRSGIKVFNEKIEIPLSGLKGLHKAVLRRLVIMALFALKADVRISFKHVDALLGLIFSASPSAAIHLPGGIRAKREYDLLLLEYFKKDILPQKQDEILINDQGVYNLQDYCIEVKHAGNTALSPYSPDIAYIDKDSVPFPLSIRFFRQGDRFAPMGGVGGKKLKEYFIDHKIPRDKRDKILLLTKGADVLWIANYRHSRLCAVKKGPGVYKYHFKCS